jgi:hypothetical protein
MSESTGSAQTSRLAELSFRLGAISLLILVITAAIVVRAAWKDGSSFPRQKQETVLGFAVGEILGQGLAAAAALSAIALGILGLAEVRRSEGQVKGKWEAGNGIGTGGLTVLTLAVVHLVVIPALIRKTMRLESSNNLKILGMAMMEYEAFPHRGLPPAVLLDPELGDRAKPYSWRVALLPIFGKQGYELYTQYRRDELWDGPNNIKLLARMPQVYAMPGSRRAMEGFTHYQVLVGPGTAFERPDLKLRSFIPDHFPRGAAQTILVVEAADPVPWTKPEDLSYTPAGPLPKVGGLVGNGFHALFADYSVRWFEAEEQKSALRTLVPRVGR